MKIQKPREIFNSLKLAPNSFQFLELLIVIKQNQIK